LIRGRLQSFRAGKRTGELEVRVFAKWFYGFDASKWPVIAFTTEAARNKLLREAEPGDVIAFVGT
jgi:hypothetical protein